MTVKVIGAVWSPTPAALSLYLASGMEARRAETPSAPFTTARPVGDAKRLQRCAEPDTVFGNVGSGVRDEKREAGTLYSLAIVLGGRNLRIKFDGNALPIHEDCWVMTMVPSKECPYHGIDTIDKGGKHWCPDCGAFISLPDLQDDGPRKVGAHSSYDWWEKRQTKMVNPVMSLAASKQEGSDGTTPGVRIVAFLLSPVLFAAPIFCFWGVFIARDWGFQGNTIAGYISQGGNRMVVVAIASVLFAMTGTFWAASFRLLRHAFRKSEP
jgi:hypothetical protein